MNPLFGAGDDVWLRVYATTMTALLRLAMFTRYPEPGKVKTRLIPVLGPEGAAQVHRRLTRIALEAVCGTGLPYTIWTTGGDEAAFRDWLGEHPFAVQPAGDLGARMARAMAAGASIIVGSDIPALRSAHIRAAAMLLARHEVVIGPATDGGYWLVGMQRLRPELYAHMPWGTDAVLAETRLRAAAHDIDLAETETLDDLDSPADLRRWPALLR